ncbi:hypothetical protein MASR2M78_32620 [Treponema sp.]
MYRDYRSNDLVAGTTLKPITWTGSSLHSEKEGPYAVSDSQFTTEILVAEASLDAQKIWTGFQSKLGEEALGLEGAKRLLIPFKLNQISSTDDFKMYIQLGSLADEDGLRNDSMALSYTAKIYDSSIDGPLSENWQIKALSLEDKDRRALASASSFRLIIQRDDPVPEDPELKFRVLVGPIKAEGSTFRPVRQEGAKLQSAEDTGSAGLAILETFDLALANTFESQIRRLHPDGETQRVLEIKWDQQDASMDINAIGFDGRKQPIPLSSYRSLGFYLRGPKADSLGEAAILSQARVHFSIGRNPDTLDLEAVIPLSSIQSDLWHFIEIRYQDEKEVYVDGERLGTASVQYRKKNVQESGGYNPTYILFLIEAAEGQILPAGSAAIDEITLSESISRYSANWGATLSWTNTGSLLKYQDISIISDPELNISVESDMSAPITGGESSGSLSSRLKGGGTLFKARLGGVLNVSIAPSGPLWSASHEVLVPIRSFSVQEAFSFDPDAEESSRKLDLKSTWPLGMDASAHLISKKLSLERGWDYAITIGGTREEEKQAPSFNVDASALWTEKGDTRLLGIQEYGPLWAATWERLVPDLGSIASKRNIKLNASTQTNTKPLGLEFLLAAQTAYVQQREATDNSASLSLGFPFVLSSLRGSFGLERSFSQNISGLSEDALSDYRSFATSMENGQNLMLSLPLYTLFDTYLDDSFDEASKGSNKSNFNDLIKIELSFQREAGLRALYLPSALRSSVARTLGRELDTHKETYVYNGSLDFSAINLFGAFGSRPLFNFYSSDELLQFWEAQVSLPRGEDPSWKLSSRLDAGFYGFTSAKLGFSNTLILEERRWSEAGRLEWAVPVQNSFLAALYDSTMQRLSLAQGFPALVELSQMEAERLRREGLEFSISGGESSNWALQLSHESLVRIVGHLTFSAFARLAISGDPKNERLSIASTIGTSLLIRY